MEIRVYNTLNRAVEPVPMKVSGEVRVYCCGPTVYDVPHAGHARSAVAFDVLVRVLRARGRRVTYVRNFTDIDDKILNRARENGEEPLALSRRMALIYQEDMAALNCLTPDHEPRVSDHLEAVYEMIRSLLDREAAYVVDRPEGTRDVYFAVRSFEGYGKLSRRRLDELRSGARVEADPHKRDPLDFALWKGTTADDWGWESPWGHGRPGWHIECSAMSTQYLGFGFDVHAGGMDLIFPHHENEIAQSEAAHPSEGPFARCWMHNGFVNVDKEKMSKSLGNFVTVRDVLARNDAEGLRWFLMTVQYRGPIQFDLERLEDGRVIFPGVDEAERRTDYLYATLERLEALARGDAADPPKLPREVSAHQAAAEESFGHAEAALADDLNTPVALAAIGEIARQSNELCDLVEKRRKDSALRAAGSGVARRLLERLRRLADELGVLQTPVEAYRARTRSRRLALRGLTEGEVEAKVAERVAARRAKDFARSDAIRDELAGKGVQLRDAPDGTTLWTVEA